MIIAVDKTKTDIMYPMLWYCIKRFDLTSIEHKYLEKGHTQNENDSMHSAIESASRNISVYTTPQWATIIQTARRNQPYSVKEMSSTDFYDFKLLSENIKNFEINTENDRLYWNQIKTLRLSSQNQKHVAVSYRLWRSSLLFGLIQEVTCQRYAKS